MVESQQVTPEEHERQLKGLPPYSYAIPATVGKIVILRYGVEGYYPLPEDLMHLPEVTLDGLNQAAGVTPLQAAAMFMGSLFGWHCEAASVHSQMYKNKTERQLKAVYNTCLLQ